MPLFQGLITITTVTTITHVHLILQQYVTFLTDICFRAKTTLFGSVMVNPDELTVSSTGCEDGEEEVVEDAVRFCKERQPTRSGEVSSSVGMVTWMWCCYHGNLACVYTI